MYCLYCHTNKVNGKRYYGITGLEPRRRWSGGRGYASSRHFHHAIEKYGWDAFEHEIVADGLTKEEACAMEVEYIERFKTTDQRYGYNISEGGQSGAAGVKQSDETRAKKSKKLKGRVFSEEHRRKLSETAKGRKFSEATLEKMRLAKKGKRLSAEHRERISRSNKGRVLSDSTKEKIRESRRAAMKRVYCVETDTTYESASEAARVLGVSRANLSATCRGKHAHVGGYHVRYVEQ